MEILQQRTTLLLKNPYEKQGLIILLQSVLAYTFHDPFTVRAFELTSHHDLG